MTNNKYREYFDIDEEYFPQVNDSAIAAASPDFWTRTYPHLTFIDMLTSMERVLARQEKRSIWIEGAYGTGKSQCAYALKKILEVPDNDLRSYWKKYEPLKNKADLLEKIIGHKKKGVLTAYRYASGMISSPRDLFLAVQETLKKSLIDAKLYTGENTLKETVIAWIEEPEHKAILNILLKKPEWAALFSQSTADDVLNSLRKQNEVKSLMDNIFRLAGKEGINAMNIDADKLLAWIIDVIDRNDIKIVFIWDEFSDYFKNNKESLSEFQKLVELVNLKPFYFIIVTHESGQLFSVADTTWTKVRDRFINVQISLPDNIAFELIGHAFNVKPAAKPDWDKLVDGDLNARVNSSRNAVMKTANINNNRVMEAIMPIHPMAALLLKNIASAFKSNQRSMFDFIKSSNTDDVKAFQWFIESTGPFDDHPLLTVDMLWNFFYEKGRDNLTSDIRLILDTFPQQQNLRDDEKKVLKAILIMQAIDQRLGGSIDLFKATDQNLSYVFEGISDLEGTKSSKLAKGLKDKGILVSNPINNGKYVYTAAVLAGDQSKIDNYKKEIRQNSTTPKLVKEGTISNVLSLSLLPALRLRFESDPGSGEIMPVTINDFTRTINNLREKKLAWKFNAVIAFAKDESEASSFRRIISTAVADKQYEEIVFIDALSTPLGLEAFEQYVDLSGYAMYYQGSNHSSSKEYSEKAKRVLDTDWKNRIYNGQFIVYSYENKEGEKLGNGQAVLSVLQTIVVKKFPYIFDFTKNLTENHLKISAAKPSAKAGITQVTSGVVVGIEKQIFPAVWKIENYWENPSTASLSISKIKIEIEKLIESSFSRDGQIAISDIYNLLEQEYGFAPCNLSAFIFGFLLKEYGGEPYRYSDSSGGHEQMTYDKLTEMIGNLIGKTPKPTFIVKMTAEEKAFYEITEKTWRIQPNSCTSASQAAIAITKEMKNLNLPVWCLKEIDTAGIYDVVQKYIELVQSEGKEAHKKAVEIGKIALAKLSLCDKLSALLTSDNCQKGMREYLNTFEDGKIIELAASIGAENNILSDIRNLFKVQYSCLWDKEIGDIEIRKLLTEYGIVKQSNSILNVSAHSLTEAYKEWRVRLKFIRVSYDALRSKFPLLEKIISMLLKIYKEEDILPEQLKMLHSELINHNAEIRDLLNNDRSVFADVYATYLEDLTENEIAEIKSTLQTGLFELPKTDCNAKVKDAAELYRKNQLKTKLLNLWKEKTGTKNPNEWSDRYKTPVLCCVSNTEYEKAKKTFEIINRSWGTDSEIKMAIEFLKSTSLFAVINDEKKRNDAFKREIIGEYSALLPDIDKVRDKLESLAVETYEWRDNPSIKDKIKMLAEAEYNSGGSDKVLKQIEKMNDVQLKQYLKKLVKGSMKVGMEILASGE